MLDDLLSCFCRHKYEFGRGKDLFVAFGGWEGDFAELEEVVVMGVVMKV